MEYLKTIDKNKKRAINRDICGKNRSILRIQPGNNFPDGMLKIIQNNLSLLPRGKNSSRQLGKKLARFLLQENLKILEKISEGNTLKRQD